MKEVGSAYTGDGYFLQCFFLLKYRHVCMQKKKIMQWHTLQCAVCRFTNMFGPYL